MNPLKHLTSPPEARLSRVPFTPILTKYLEDHPLSKWLVTMVIVSPSSGVAPLPNGLNLANKWWLLTTY